jgi:hypothetical protein
MSDPGFIRMKIQNPQFKNPKLEESASEDLWTNTAERVNISQMKMARVLLFRLFVRLDRKEAK